MSSLSHQFMKEIPSDDPEDNDEIQLRKKRKIQTSFIFQMTPTLKLMMTRMEKGKFRRQLTIKTGHITRG